VLPAEIARALLWWAISVVGDFGGLWAILPLLRWAISLVGDFGGFWAISLTKLTQLSFCGRFD
jgi:hypothetical protein